MILLPPDLMARLRANADATRAAQAEGRREPDPVPVLKLFNPLGAATWLFTELDEDGDTLFGLCDLGFGTPELGYASLSEIASIRLPFGLGIERDLGFEGHFPLSVYAEAARIEGRITQAETLLSTLAWARASCPPTLRQDSAIRRISPRGAFPRVHSGPPASSRQIEKRTGRFTQKDEHR